MPWHFPDEWQFPDHIQLHHDPTQKGQPSRPATPQAEASLQSTSASATDIAAVMNQAKATLESYRAKQCPDCKKIFSRENNMRAHLLIHSSDPLEYKCEKCEKSFKQERNLRRHLEEQHCGGHFECESGVVHRALVPFFVIASVAKGRCGRGRERASTPRYFATPETFRP